MDAPAGDAGVARETLLEDALKQVSAEMYGGAVELRAVDPKRLVYLKRNARYFTKATFDQLVANVEADRRLSSVPYCLEQSDGALLVVSGNHRVKAAVKAGLGRILVFV